MSSGETSRSTAFRFGPSVYASSLRTSNRIFHPLVGRESGLRESHPRGTSLVRPEGLGARARRRPQSEPSPYEARPTTLRPSGGTRGLSGSQGRYTQAPVGATPSVGAPLRDRSAR